MIGKSLMFFSTRDELIEVFKSSSLVNSYKFVLHDNIHDKNVEEYQSIEDIPDLCISTSGSTTPVKRYFMIPSNKKLNLRKVKLIDGSGYTYHANPGNKNVVFDPGGVYNDYEAIIYSELYTVSEDEWSLNLYKSLSKKLKKDSRKFIHLI